MTAPAATPTHRHDTSERIERLCRHGRPYPHAIGTDDPFRAFRHRFQYCEGPKGEPQR